MSADKNPRYGPVPSRACRDLRLGAAHFRVLTAIASFDRFGKNGQGCWVAQNRIAALVECSKSHLSNILGDLRDWGYLTSKLNPEKRWFRIHRVIYTEKDSDCLETDKSVHSRVNRSVPSQGNKLVHSRRNRLDKSVHSGDQISSLGSDDQFTSPPKKDSKTNDIKNMDYSPNRDRTIEEGFRNLVKGQNCAEARSQFLPLADAEKYLAEFERTADSDERDSLKHERPQLQRIAEDGCLPQEVNERAARFLAWIQKTYGSSA